MLEKEKNVAKEEALEVRGMYICLVRVTLFTGRPVLCMLLGTRGNLYLVRLAVVLACPTIDN